MFGRTAVLIALALALALPAAAPAHRTASPKPPTGLKAFLLRYDETTKRSFGRTPSFGWKPVAQAVSYDFQLATSTTFRENSIAWSTTSLTAPYTAVPVALPWTTGHPYSLFARVRAHTAKKTTAWSSNFGFNVRWTDVPSQLPAPNGLLRWTPIDGATSYEILEVGGSWMKTASVATNVSDMRDWFTFHQSAAWVSAAHWRVRPVRVTYGALENSSTTVSYGPWSSMFTTNATPPSGTSVITLGDTASDVLGTVASPAAHKVMPGLSWSGMTSKGIPYALYRPYVFSDSDCLEPVLVGSIVGSPAWVPRLNGPLLLPTSDADIGKASVAILADGDQKGAIFDYSRRAVVPSETPVAASAETTTTTARLDLWDRDWPSGGYYWTVVPVVPVHNLISGSDVFEYQDVESPQDACAAGRVARFGRVSEAVPTDKTNAYVTSLSTAGKMKSNAASTSPTISGNSPLVSWTPAIGADSYEVQWSHSSYPFTVVGKVATPATSAGLSLTPGNWYYRVRGVDSSMPSGAQGMAWSSVRKLKIAKPVFRVSR